MLTRLLCLLVGARAALRGEGLALPFGADVIRGEAKVVVDIPHARRVQLSCKGHAPLGAVALSVGA